MTENNREFQVAWEESTTWRKILFVLGCTSATQPMFWLTVGLAYLIYNEGERFFGEAFFRRTVLWGILVLIVWIFLILLFGLLVVLAVYFGNVQ